MNSLAKKFGVAALAGTMGIVALAPQAQAAWHGHTYHHRSNAGPAIAGALLGAVIGGAFANSYYDDYGYGYGRRYASYGGGYYGHNYRHGWQGGGWQRGGRSHHWSGSAGTWRSHRSSNGQPANFGRH